jgi:hypothetical protein
MARRLGEAYGAGHSSTVDELPKVTLYLSHHIPAELGAWVKHGEQEAVDL